MSIRFENALIMPDGHLGHATLLRLPGPDRESVLRWHYKEWLTFINEVRAYQSKAYAALHDLHMRQFHGPHRQRGSIQVAGFGVTSVLGAGETVTLSGTSGSPNASVDKEDTPTNALAGWRWQSDGDVESIVADVWTEFQSGTEWVDTSTPGNYWLQATLDAGDTPTTHPGLGSFLQLDIQRSYTWLEDSDPPGFASTAGTLQIDISSQSDGTPILDTGFYRGTASQNGTA